MKNILNFLALLAIVLFLSNNAAAGSTVHDGSACSTDYESSSMNSNFYGTPIAGGNFIWFNSDVRMSGVGSSSVEITVSFTEFA